MPEPSDVRPVPCPTCPFRVNCPSGVWAASEYRLLPAYDGDAADQAAQGGTRPFFCHSTPDRLCAGWVGHRASPHDLIALRIAVSAGRVLASVLRYTTRVPLWPSGADAARHGLRDIAAPGEAARAAMAKVASLRAATGRPVDYS